MTDDAWWRDPTVRPRLHAALGYLTQALRKSPDESLARCERLADASNQLWSIYRLQQGRPKDSDWQAVKGMLTEGTPAERRGKLAANRSLRRLAEFRPYIQNHHALLEAGNPWDPPDELWRTAERPHRRFARAWEAWHADAREESERRLLIRLADVVSVVRGNIAHGEKTAQGPTQGVGERNQAVAAVMESAWWAIFESLLDHPCHRLAVYGTLAPGEVNASLLESLEGTWEPGAVRGNVTEIAGLPALRLVPSGDAVPVQIFTSRCLPDEWARLDAFESPAYERAVALVERDTAPPVAACIYEPSWSGETV